MPRPKKSDGLSSKNITNATKLHRHFTNFNRENALTYGYEVVQEPKEDYWSFTTNIDPDYFELEMSPKQQRNFLYKMYEIFKNQKVSL